MTDSLTDNLSSQQYMHIFFNKKLLYKKLDFTSLAKCDENTIGRTKEKLRNFQH